MAATIWLTRLARTWSTRSTIALTSTSTALVGALPRRQRSRSHARNPRHPTSVQLRALVVMRSVPAGRAGKAPRPARDNRRRQAVDPARRSPMPDRPQFLRVKSLLTQRFQIQLRAAKTPQHHRLADVNRQRALRRLQRIVRRLHVMAHPQRHLRLQWWSSHRKHRRPKRESKQHLLRRLGTRCLRSPLRQMELRCRQHRPQQEAPPKMAPLRPRLRQRQTLRVRRLRQLAGSPTKERQRLKVVSTLHPRPSLPPLPSLERSQTLKTAVHWRCHQMATKRGKPSPMDPAFLTQPLVIRCLMATRSKSCKTTPIRPRQRPVLAQRPLQGLHESITRAPSKTAALRRLGPRGLKI
mmetsp:Transcript_36486/g.100476  ORF Transcript_36486/g.100476 Transcript_36486/m.100476 type:complete len:353 (-) Transcript_36486:916-1974(-)